ncbi:MAG: DUF1963 domain-containing protein [Deltaproteobacteria bacterium]|nr:DUF1963 domain-containing protein [Deltaproteobacteria bacterium]MDQ3298269.1 YwqG family protein [Myxococcota bacterium]
MKADAALAKLGRGEDVWDAKTLKAALTAGTDALLAAFTGAVKAKQDAYAGALSRVMAQTPAGIVRLVELACTERKPKLQLMALRAVFYEPTGESAEPQIPSKPLLDKIVDRFDLLTWDGKGGQDAERVYAMSSLALFWLDPTRAYEVGAKLLSPKALAKREGVTRAEALFMGVPKRTEDGWPMPKFDPRWPALLAPLVKKLEHSVLFMLDALPPDPIVIEPVLAWLGKHPDKVTYFDNTSISILGRVADARVVPYLVAALRASWVHFPAVFEGFRVAGDPAMAHVIREWLKTNGSKERNKLGNAIIKELEAKGKAPKPAAPSLEKPPAPPKRRPTLKFKKAPQYRPIKLPSLDKQRAAIVEWLGKIGFEGRAGAVITQCCVLDPVRVDESTLAIGASKLGGHPDLSANTPWPTVGVQHLVFLAQIDLAEAAPHLPKGALPKTGLLSVFLADDPERHYLDIARVIFTPAKTKIVRHEVPADYTQSIYQACRVTMQPYLKVPAFDDPMIRKLGIETAADSWFGPAGVSCQLLGSRDHNFNLSLGDDARLLFQCPSHDQADMQFGDVDTVGIFLPAEALAKHDFASAYPYVGD